MKVMIITLKIWYDEGEVGDDNYNDDGDFDDDNDDDNGDYDNCLNVNVQDAFWFTMFMYVLHELWAWPK